MTTTMYQSILATLVYFDLIEYPLTEEELYYFLWQTSLPYASFKNELQKIVQNHSEIEEQWGFYFLKGRRSIIERRRERTVTSEKLLKKAFRAAKYIRSVPFLKAVFVCNSVGGEVATAKSDVDFLIITSPGRIWIVRFFTNLLLRVLRLRTYGNHEAGRICLSFYLDTNHLDLAPHRVRDDDIHFAYWLHQMLPLYDPEGWYSALIKANTWTQKYLPNYTLQFTLTSTEKIKNSRAGTVLKKILQKMWEGNYGTLIENEAQKLQWHKLKLSLKEKSRVPDQGVVIKEGILKFHEHDTRKEYYEKWSTNYQKLLTSLKV